MTTESLVGVHSGTRQGGAGLGSQHFLMTFPGAGKAQSLPVP